MTNNVHKARYGSIDKKEGRKTRQNNEIAGFPAFGKAPKRAKSLPRDPVRRTEGESL